MIKKILKYIGIFLGVLFLMVGALDLVAKIPRSAIEENSVKSADYMRERPEFRDRIFDMRGTRSDYYADSVSLSINYGIDPNDSLRTVVLAKYATDEPFITQLYIEQVEGKVEAEQEYLRYWHGYLAVLRPLMVVFSIEQIYLLNTIIICGLMIAIIVLLYRHKETVAMVAFTVSMLAVWFFAVPTILEYTWMFILMLIGCLLTMNCVWRGKTQRMPIILFVMGMLAAYFDFLTTETITLTMPLIMVVWLNRKKVKSNDTIKQCAKGAILWLVAFVATWVAKWLLASLVLGENVWPYISGHISERLFEDFWYNGNPILMAIFGLLFNIENLMMFCTGGFGGIIVVIAIVTIAFLLKEFRCKKYNKYVVKTLGLICLIPLIRMLVLDNHSYWHNFFVFRALCAPIFAGILIVVEKVDWKKARKELMIKK